MDTTKIGKCYKSDFFLLQTWYQHTTAQTLQRWSQAICVLFNLRINSADWPLTKLLGPVDLKLSYAEESLEGSLLICVLICARPGSLS